MTWTVFQGDSKPVEPETNGGGEGRGERQNITGKRNLVTLLIVVLIAALVAGTTFCVTVLFVPWRYVPDTSSTRTPTTDITPSWTTSQDNSFESVLHRKRVAAQQWLVSRRKANWGWGGRINAEAVIALQLNGEGAWCCGSKDSQLSGQRIQIELLDAIARNGTLEQRDWFGGKLGQYVTGLVAVCQNPRDFYGRDLIKTLRYHLDTFHRYWFNLFAYNWALIGLHNAGEPIDDRFIKTLLKKQRDGSFGGVDTTAMSIMSLACVRHMPGVNNTLTAAVKYLMSRQQQDGSYGNEMSTGLALQALKASGTRLSKEDHRASAETLMRAIRQDGSMEMVGVSFPVLPALAHRAYTDVVYLVKCQ